MLEEESGEETRLTLVRGKFAILSLGADYAVRDIFIA